MEDIQMLEYLKSDKGLEQIRIAASDLPSREKQIVYSLFGINGTPILGQSEIARIQNCSRQNIHKIKKRAIARIASNLQSMSLNGE